MITVYKHIEEELVADYTVSDATKGSWVNLVNPDPDELSLINILTEDGQISPDDIYLLNYTISDSKRPRTVLLWKSSSSNRRMCVK